MRAVNLAPTSGRRFGGQALPDIGGGTAALFGLLAVALVMVVGWVTLSNRVTDREQQLADITAQQVKAEKQVAELKPYADLEGVRQSLMEKVRSLAGGRYDWPMAVDKIVRAFPSDVTLTSFEGSPAAAAGSTDGAAAPAPGAAAAPAGGPKIDLGGCAASHESAARLVDRLRAVKVVAGVTLQSSVLADSGGEGCPGKETFKLQVLLKGQDNAAAAAGTPATPGAPAPTTTTPAPASSAPTASAGTSTGGAS